MTLTNYTEPSSTELLKLFHPTNWIPCSEKLPKPGEKVLVCLVDRRRRKVDSKYCGEMLYTIRIDKIVKYTEETIPFWAKGNTPSVLAWMPLPEAYRGGQENETD